MAAASPGWLRGYTSPGRAAPRPQASSQPTRESARPPLVSGVFLGAQQVNWLAIRCSLIGRTSLLRRGRQSWALSRAVNSKLLGNVDPGEKGPLSRKVQGTLLSVNDRKPLGVQGFY